MDIEVKKKGLQSLMKALAMMPEGSKVEMEKGESKEMPMPGVESVDEKESVKEEAPMVSESEEPEADKMAMKSEPSVSEKLALDDLSLQELKALKDKMKAMGIL